MRKHDLYRCVLVAGLLATFSTTTYAEPVPLTSVSFHIDHTEANNPLSMEGSGPGTALRLFGVWTEHLGRSLGDGFVDTSFSGVFAFDDQFDESDNQIVELQVGDRALNFSGTINLTVIGPRVPTPHPRTTVVRDSSSFPVSFGVR